MGHEAENTQASQGPGLHLPPSSQTAATAAGAFLSVRPPDRFALQRKRKQREKQAAKEPQGAESVAEAGHRLGKLVVQGPALLQWAGRASHL